MGYCKNSRKSSCSCCPSRGATGATGAAGATGADGADGATGATGAAALTADFAEFFALMPPDNIPTIAVDAPVLFPQDGPTSGGGITRTGAGSFNLAEIGTYRVLFQVSVDEPGQLLLYVDGAEVPHTVVGRATGTSQIVGQSLITTTVVDSVLEVRNASGNSTALTITPIAGGTHPVSASLIIERLA